MKREYDECKVRINSLPEAIRRRYDAYNMHEDLRAKKKLMLILPAPSFAFLMRKRFNNPNHFQFLGFFDTCKLIWDCCR